MESGQGTNKTTNNGVRSESNAAGHRNCGHDLHWIIIDIDVEQARHHDIRAAGAARWDLVKRNNLILPVNLKVNVVVGAQTCGCRIASARNRVFTALIN